MVFQLAESAEKHLAVHFSGPEKSGSTFYPSFLAGPKDLLAFLESNQPQEIIHQKNQRVVFQFELPAPQVAGLEGIGLKETLPPDSISLQERNSFLVEIGIVEVLPETPFFCVVLNPIPAGFEVVTAFPGRYAPSFPYEGQEPDEYASSQEFWSKYVLLRKNESADK